MSRSPSNHAADPADHAAQPRAHRSPAGRPAVSWSQRAAQSAYAPRRSASMAAAKAVSRAAARHGPAAGARRTRGSSAAGASPWTNVTQAARRPASWRCGGRGSRRGVDGGEPGARESEAVRADQPRPAGDRELRGHRRVTVGDRAVEREPQVGLVPGERRRQGRAGLARRRTRRTRPPRPGSGRGAGRRTPARRSRARRRAPCRLAGSRYLRRVARRPLAQHDRLVHQADQRVKDLRGRQHPRPTVIPRGDDPPYPPGRARRKPSVPDPQTASAAARSKLPAKTDRRRPQQPLGGRAQVVAPGDGRVQRLLAVAAASRRPLASSRRWPGSLASSSSRLTARSRSAASSIASGMPSSRRHRPHELGQGGGGDLEAGDRRRGPVGEQADRLAARRRRRPPSGGMRKTTSPGRSSGWRPVTSSTGLARRRAGSRRRASAHASTTCSHGVKDQQQPPAAQPARRASRPTAGPVNPACPGSPTAAERGTRARTTPPRPAPRTGRRGTPRRETRRASSPATLTASRVLPTPPGTRQRDQPRPGPARP